MQQPNQSPETTATLDAALLEREVRKMYTEVAHNPQADFHFHTGRLLAERLGYPSDVLERVPAPATESFAGVGYHFDLAALKPGERVVDLGSGSGMDAFFAATQVGEHGEVIGVDMTQAQREKAIGLRDARPDLAHTRFVDGYIEQLPIADGYADCVISNGVINLIVDKEQVFREAARVLKPGGRLAISDIVTRVLLPETVVCDATLWAACIGGAMHREDYQRAIEAAGFEISVIQSNPQYHFIPGRAERSAQKFGVCSISLVAHKR